MLDRGKTAFATYWAIKGNLLRSIYSQSLVNHTQKMLFFLAPKVDKLSSSKSVSYCLLAVEVDQFYLLETFGTERWLGFRWGPHIVEMGALALTAVIADFLFFTTKSRLHGWAVRGEVRSLMQKSNQLSFGMRQLSWRLCRLSLSCWKKCIKLYSHINIDDDNNNRMV